MNANGDNDVNANTTIRIVQEQVRQADPHAITDSRTLLNIRGALYDSLVRRTGPGQFQPALASAWSCEPDARTWTFTIRDGVRFHDGRSVTTGDVVAGIERATSPEAGGEMATEGVMASYFEGSTVEALSDTQVRIVMGRPMADLLDLLVDIVILPGGEANSEAAIGTGPFRLIEARDGEMVMEAFSDGWQGAPTVGQLQWFAEPDPAKRSRLLIEGAADLAVGLGPDERAMIEQSAGVDAIASPGGLCVAFLLNAANGPCADPRVRQALNFGTDVDRIIAEVTNGQATPTNGPFTPLHVGHDPDVPRYGHDLGRARSLLAEAGYGDGLELTIDVPTRLPDEAQALAEHLTRSFADLGVTVTLRHHEDRLAYARMVRAKQIADACCFDSSPLSTYRVLREKLHGGVAGPWWQGYANPDVDALIDRAATIVDNSERQEIYRQAYRQIHEDAPWVFMYAPLMVDGRGPALGGWQPGINGIVRFDRE